jgi:hypothetical protein
MHVIPRWALFVQPTSVDATRVNTSMVLDVVVIFIFEHLKILEIRIFFSSKSINC